MATAMSSSACLPLVLGILLASCNQPSQPDSGNAEGAAWPRHTIDDSSAGADGVRLADINGDGRLDITSPWEQGGQVRVYLHPGDARLRERWPAVTVGEVGDPEDSFFVDLDGDGALDVVSSCEGDTRSIFVHWAPFDRSEILNPDAWQTEPLPASSGEAQWMFAFAMQVDGKAGVDLVAGSKREGAGIGWFESPENPRDLAAWKWHRVYEAGWVMTLRPHDIDGDGDQDIVATDRRGPRRGTLWLENPGAENAAESEWREHRIGPVDEHEAMHNAIADLDQDGLSDVLAAVKGGPNWPWEPADSDLPVPIRFHRRTAQTPPIWQTRLIDMPANAGSGKGVEVADIDLDGRLDVVISCEHAYKGRVGVFWMSYDESPTEPQWAMHSISGSDGYIFDLIQLADLDGDRDMDVITLEEKGPYLARGYQGKELGVVWYENPAR